MSYTLAGPPERISPFGCIAAISAAGVSKRMISEYTWHSRIRRAMTCVYCEPKSRMRIFECVRRSEVFTFYGCVCGTLCSAAGSSGAPPRSIGPSVPCPVMPRPNCSCISCPLRCSSGSVQPLKASNAMASGIERGFIYPFYEAPISLQEG